ncbi:MAG: HrgA protein [Bilophila wadsworthia]
MALSQSQKIIAFLEKHRGGSFTARQIAEAIVQQYASDYAKKRNNPRFADDKAFLSQIIAEIGSQKDTLKRLRPTLVWQDRPKPRRYCIPLEETQEALDTAQGETCERDEEICACEERALLEQELYPLLTSYLWSELHLYSMRIREGRSHNTRGNGGNQWLHPDIVAMEPVDKAWGNTSKPAGTPAAAPASGSGRLKSKNAHRRQYQKMLLSGRQQLVLAHEGYLVATAIADDRVEQELRMLSALHGIGVILLDPENPSESEILLPAQKKPDADWQSIDRLAKENGDFHEFIELVSVYFQTGTLREKDWDNKTA